MSINDFYYWKLLIQPGLMTFGISIAIFCILTVKHKRFKGLALHTGIITFVLKLQVNYISGYGSSIFIYVQLLILCHMGSAVKTCVKIQNYLQFEMESLLLLNCYLCIFVEWGTAEYCIEFFVVPTTDERTKNAWSYLKPFAKWRNIDNWTAVWFRSPDDFEGIPFVMV